MKSSVIRTFVVSGIFVFAVAVHAQQPKSQEHSMTGCLQAGTEGNTYMLTNVEGSGPKTVGVISSSANLAPHVGHKISITGTAVDAKEAETDKKTPKSDHYMKVSAVKMISASCP